MSGSAYASVPPAVGVVAIGRNEGERLRRCFDSLAPTAARIVYVDSGSRDGSVALARARGIEVVELDLRVPFTAARARNEGFARLRAIVPQLAYVQFIDGDCEIAARWIGEAVAWLEANPSAAVACGRRRERHPRQSVYNLLCDIEWDTPVGRTAACGGDAMMRASAFETVGGFRADVIAGEEPELCVRLRRAGWSVWRLDAEMTTHDAAMTRFAQWWRRALRAGYAYAGGAALHGGPPEHYGVRESARIWAWAAGVPLAAALGALLTGGWGLLLLLLYPAQVARLAVRGPRTGADNWRHAVFLMLAKFPEWLGQLKYLAERAAGRRARLIEYK